MQVEYSTIPYTSTFIRLSNLYQEFNVDCVVIINDGSMGWVGKGGVVNLYQGVGLGTGGRYYLIVVVFF